MVNPYQLLARSIAGWRGCVLGLLLGIQACASVPYEPTMPMGARSGDVEWRLKFVRVGTAREFVLESHSAAAHSIQRGWLTVATRGPCTAGAEADEVLVDGNTTTPASLTEGSHEVRVRFDGRADDLSLDLVLDLELEKGLCVRTPVVSQSIPLEAKKRPLVVGSMLFDGNADLSGLRALFGGQVGFGEWLGPVLLTAEAGLGGSVCNAGACGKASNGDLKTGIAIPFTIDASASVGHVVWNKVPNAGLLGARYSYVPVRLPLLDGDRWLSVHGFYGVLGWGVGQGTKAPIRHAERTTLYELAIPIGILVEPSAATHKVAFAAGFGLRIFIPL